MPAPVIAIFPGTFDPITRGHEEMIRRAAALFGTVLVAVASAHHKKTLFSLDERLEMAADALHAVANVRILSLTGLVSEFARTHAATVLVRGVRSVADFDYECQLAGMNRHLNAALETVFLVPDPQYQHVSSTLVREIALLGGDVAPFVQDAVLQRLLRKRGQG